MQILNKSYTCKKWPIKNHRGRPHRNRNDNDNNNDDNNNPPQVTLSQADLMAIATIVATTLQGLEAPNNNQCAPPLPPANGTKFHYKSLRKKHCHFFVMDTSPEGGHNCIKSVETQLRLLKVPEALKVEVVTRKWWEAVSPAMTV